MKIKKKAPKQKEVVTESERVQNLYDDLSFKFEDIFSKYSSAIIAAIVIIIVVGLGVLGYRYMSGKWDKDASALESTAYNYYVEGNYKEAITAYQKITEKYSSSDNAPVAMYYLGNSYLGLGQNDEAIKTYQKAIEKYKNEKTIIPLAWTDIGYAYMNKKDYANAISAFKQAATAGNSLVADRAVYETALAFEASGNKTSAVERYEYLKKVYPNSPLTQDAVAKLNKIQGNTPVLQPPQVVNQPAKIEVKEKK
ncbi:MAG: tetratricopeptide repeat protein [Nitrospirae bacterium]|nr:tetratricopeptide repeat protein [Nitrospirota bacterium]